MRLGELCTPKQWKSLKQSEMTSDGYPVYGANGVIGCYSEYNHAEETILVGCRGTCGEINLCAPYSYVTSNAMCLDKLSERVDRDYLICFLKAYNFEKVVGGTSQPQITKAGISSIEIPLFSLEQQTAIRLRLKSILDELLSCKALLEKLDALVKSRFVEMFGDPVSNEMGWPASTIKETAIIYGDGPFGSNLKSSDYVDEGVRVIRLGNIQQGYFSEKDQTFVSYEKYEQLDRYKCSPGEIVIATLGSPILRACLVPDSCDPSIHKADCMYYEVDRDRLVPTFAMRVINHPSMLRRAAMDVHGQTRGRINSTQTGALPMILPPLSLQQEFASFVAEVDKSRFVARRIRETLGEYNEMTMEHVTCVKGDSL